MEQKTIKRIQKINTMDTEVLPIVLIRAEELFWGLDRIVEDNTKEVLSEVSSNKKKLKIMKELIGDFGAKISFEYINTWGDGLFSKELLRYLGFDVRDEVTDEIIFDYCTSTDKNKDIKLLKVKLIEAAIEWDEVDEEDFYKGLEEQFEEEQETARLSQLLWVRNSEY